MGGEEGLHMLDIVGVGEQFHRVDHANDRVRGETVIRLAPMVSDEPPRSRTVMLIRDTGPQQEWSVLSSYLRR